MNRVAFSPDGLDPTSHATIVTALQQRGWTLTVNALTLSDPVVAGSVRKLTFTSSGSGAPSNGQIPILGTAPTQLKFGMRWGGNQSGANVRIVRFLDAAVLMGELGVNADGSLTAYRNTTSLGSSAAGVMPLSLAETYIEIDIKYHASTGWFKVYLNGSATPVINLTGINTITSGVGQATNIQVCCTTANSANIQTVRDLYLNDDAGSANNTLLGDTTIARLVPSTDDSVGMTRSTGASNFAIAGKTPWDVASNVASAVSGTLDQYGLTDLPAMPASIFFVRGNALWDKSDAGARDGSIGVNSGGTISDSAAITPATSVGMGTALWETDPATAVAWTAAGVNGLKGRVKVAA